MGSQKGSYYKGNTKTHKLCPKCKIKKKRSEFKNRAYCRACINKGAFAWYEGNTDTHKRCPCCGIVKERSEFYKWKSRKDGLTAYCKPCFLEKNKNWQDDNPEKIKISNRKTHLKAAYGLSLEDRENMLKNQDYKCDICHKEIKTYSAVDHDHKTGKIRSLLCRKCNLGLGAAKDNTEILKNMINYLENYENL